MTELMPMPDIERSSEGDDPVDEAELAAAAFLARYQGRTLDALPLRPAGLLPVGGRRAPRRPQGHPATGRAVRACNGGSGPGRHHHRPPAVDGLRLLRFAHIDGRIASNPAQYVRRPKVHPTEARGLDRAELGAP